MCGGLSECATSSIRHCSKFTHLLIELGSNFTPFIYSNDLPPEVGLLMPRSRKGRETSTYLSYILDHYDKLPKFSVFIHSNHGQWHNDILGPSTADILPALRFEAVHTQGYVNLRCLHEPGCPIDINPLEPTQHDIDTKDTRAYFADIYMELFAVELKDVPQHLGGVCCAQFAVSRARIRQRPRSDYERMLKWADEVTIVDDFGVGWVFEKVWHVVFGMGAV